MPYYDVTDICGFFFHHWFTAILRLAMCMHTVDMVCVCVCVCVHARTCLHVSVCMHTVCFSHICTM